MKTYICTYRTNYGLAIIVINAENMEDAKEIARAHGAWPGFYVEEINTTKKGVTFTEHS